MLYSVSTDDMLVLLIYLVDWKESIFYRNTDINYTSIIKFHIVFEIVLVAKRWRYYISIIDLQIALEIALISEEMRTQY